MAVLVLIGLGLLLPMAAASPAPARDCAALGSIAPVNHLTVLPPDEAEAATKAANTDDAVRASVEHLRERGFTAVEERVAFRDRPNQSPDLRPGRRGCTGCTVFCLSAQCGSNANKCNGIPHLGAKLACMLAVCGSAGPEL